MKLKTPKGLNTRPTVDSVKESVFNILNPYIQGSKVLDLFAGTGALAIEALSRGAEYACFVEENRNCCGIIRENLAHTKFIEKGTVYCRKVSAFLRENCKNGVRFDIVFMDPPYSNNFIQETLQLLMENDIINDKGIVVVEHHKNEDVPDSLGNLKKVRVKNYGDTRVSFLVKE
ncbi:MAG: 16S rRNA (guanine(966)-N(2))-methyltransferase RsmD [Clostridiaceae bacterium]|jgi:16S rRNA (guanine(966)-N(2))-methyltransferase RsmD|nr:16S rRNA (guanine(966)-N(2))-methyltransferase RsmD [Clostridiaceae bacterium]